MDVRGVARHYSPPDLYGIKTFKIDGCFVELGLSGINIEREGRKESLPRQMPVSSGAAEGAKDPKIMALPSARCSQNDCSTARRRWVVLIKSSASYQHGMENLVQPLYTFRTYLLSRVSK